MAEKYLGLFKGKKVSLKVLGEKIGVSPQRTRIILKNGNKKAEHYIKLHLPHLQQTMKKPLEAPDNGVIVKEKFVHYLLMEGLNKHLSP
ncbi:hypothetical protein CR203_23665 [Salipaludibacillus neizhouensis]|uniref:Uncharacterized protein n=2 Tax=Salipaludibacillus neizhouensis TaxID=885475 RepID=A0A3A9K3P4_9BACI|nr:hypothetical protein [Salipaludibacillus neizhouensis]RKL64901.1 hypothetical protein CR203_23665 [Salipaludibacillus neizhouensis]